MKTARFVWIALWFFAAMLEAALAVRLNSLSFLWLTLIPAGMVAVNLRRLWSVRKQVSKLVAQ
jgi:hypothetical protein